jgi:hypothetical protein
MREALVEEREREREREGSPFASSLSPLSPLLPSPPLLSSPLTTQPDPPAQPHGQ